MLKISDFGLSALYTGAADDTSRATVRARFDDACVVCYAWEVAALTHRCTCMCVRTAAAHDVWHAKLRRTRGAERQGVRRPRGGRVVDGRHPVRSPRWIPALR
jgi:hypothetical protein